MRFFKYIFILITLLFSQNIFAACEAGIVGSFTSNLTDPPYRICATHADFGSSKCIMLLDNMQQTSTGWTLFAKTTGEECSSVTNLNKPTQYECNVDVCPVDQDQSCPSGYSKGMYNGQLSCVKDKDDNDTLVCNADFCPNPSNKKCPYGYVKGSLNGVTGCAKSDKDDEEQCTDCSEGEASIVAAVNNANNSITDSIFSLGSNILQSLIIYLIN